MWHIMQRHVDAYGRPLCAYAPTNPNCLTQLDGGLNNALMHLAQWTADACTPNLNSILYTSGNGWIPKERRGQLAPYAWHNLTELFDVRLLQKVIKWRRAQVAAGPPFLGNCNVSQFDRVPPLASINTYWSRNSMWLEALANYYRALALAPPLKQLLHDFLREHRLSHASHEAPLGAGAELTPHTAAAKSRAPEWVAIHLRMENDWVIALTLPPPRAHRTRGVPCPPPHEFSPARRHGCPAGSSNVPHTEPPYFPPCDTAATRWLIPAATPTRLTLLRVCRRWLRMQSPSRPRHHIAQRCAQCHCLPASLPGRAPPLSWPHRPSGSQDGGAHPSPSAPLPRGQSKRSA